MTRLATCRDGRLEVLEGLVQRRDKPDAATYIGSGKAQELREVVPGDGADTVVCDGELTAGAAHGAGEDRQGQGHRPDSSDSRHLCSARHVS